MRDNARDVVRNYQKQDELPQKAEIIFSDFSSNEYSINGVLLLNSKNELCVNFAHDEEIILEVDINCNKKADDVLLAIHVYDILGKRIFTSQHPMQSYFSTNKNKKFRLHIPANLLTPQSFTFSIGLHIPNIKLLDLKSNIVSFNIYDNGSEFYRYKVGEYGVVFANCSWEIM